MPQRQPVREIIFPCCNRLNSLSEQFSTVTKLYPNIGELFEKTIRDADLKHIKARDFKPNKERLGIIQFLLDRRKDLDQTTCRKLIELITKDHLSQVRDILDGSSRTDPTEAKPMLKKLLESITPAIFTDKDVSPSQKLIDEAHSTAVHISDSDFLQRLDDISEDDETLKTAIAETKNIAQGYLKSIISKLLKKLVHVALRIQQEDCIKQIRREVSIQAKRDTERFRREFVHKIEEHSQSGPVL